MGNHCPCDCPEDEAVVVDQRQSDRGMLIVTYECSPCGCEWEVAF